jgi:hypothetical protein
MDIVTEALASPIVNNQACGNWEPDHQSSRKSPNSKAARVHRILAENFSDSRWEQERDRSHCASLREEEEGGFDKVQGYHFHNSPRAVAFSPFRENAVVCHYSGFGPSAHV